MVEHVYALQGTDGTIDQAMTKYFADKLWSATVKGYGKDLPGVDFDTPDYNMLSGIKENVWQFASAKNYQQLRELSDLLLDENGLLRPFEKFLELAKGVNDKFVKSWLKTEYNLAVTGGQMASKWVDIQANAATLPYLRFVAILDGQTTDLCKSLHGTVLKWDHPFWKIYYLPNHYGERSTIEQLAFAVETPEFKIPTADIPKMFQSNLAERGLIFPDAHPYFIGIPPEVLSQYKAA